MTREEKLQQFAEQTTKGLYLDRHNLIQMVKQGAEWADQHPQWISVEERKPNEGQVVLIHTKGGSVSTACYTDGRFDITELFQAINVTHWMEIVPPRKEK